MPEKEKVVIVEEKIIWYQDWRRMLLIFAILCFIIPSIVLIILSIEQSASKIPRNIDAVIVLDNDSERSTHLAQVHSIKKYMPWISTIYVLTNKNEVEINEGVQYYKLEEDNGKVKGENTKNNNQNQPSLDISSYFVQIPSIPDINSHVIFFGDYTMPMKPISKSYFFFNGRPRIFNEFRDLSTTRLFDFHMAHPTLATMVSDVSLIKKAMHSAFYPSKIREEFNETSMLVNGFTVGSPLPLASRKLLYGAVYSSYLLLEISQNKAMLRNNLCQDVFFHEGFNNVEEILKDLVEDPPLFATFFISGQETKPIHDVIKRHFDKVYPTKFNAPKQAVAKMME